MEKLPSLYVLAGEYRALMDKLTDHEFDDQTIADTIDSTGIIDDIQTKAQNLEMVARNFLQTDAMLDDEIVRLQALRQYLKVEMEHMGIKRIECPLFTIALRANPGSVEIFDARQLPLDYWRTPPAPEPTPDKKMIADALKSGTDVPGARLEQKNRLAIS